MSERARTAAASPSLSPFDESGSGAVLPRPSLASSGEAVRGALVEETRRQRGFSRLLVADAAVLLLSMCAINLARFGTDWPTYPLTYYAIGFLVATGLHVGVYYFSGLYERQPRLGREP